MPAVFCPACSSILMAPQRDNGPRVHCPQCGEVITLAGLSVEVPARLMPRTISAAMLREWQDRFPFAPQPAVAMECPRL